MMRLKVSESLCGVHIRGLPVLHLAHSKAGIFTGGDEMQIIDFQGNKRPAEYLGDGVYAIFDGFGVWLHTNDHANPTDRVYLEPNVMQALIRFEKNSKSEEIIKLCTQ